MTNEELQKFINRLEEQDLKSQATFGILLYGGGADESFIRANRQGLLLFANELLKAAKDAENIILDSRKTSIPVDSKAEWIDEESDTLVQYIEPITERKNNNNKNNYKKTLVHKLLPVAFIAVAVICTIALLVGLWTLGKWIF